MTTSATAPRLRVRYGTQFDHVWLVRDEFGTFAIALATSWDEAWMEALEMMLDRDGPCDHGIAESELMFYPARIEAMDSCDCDVSEDGTPVWAVYLSIQKTDMPIAEFEKRYGTDADDEGLPFDVREYLDFRGGL